MNRRYRWLIRGSIFLMGLLAANLVGLLLDPRSITGSPAWLKPAKFAVSGAIYLGTLAWILSQTTVWPRFVTLMGEITTAMMVIELGIINLQAWRGTTSHFNVGTALDGSLFATMGISIAIMWLASFGIACALFRQPFPNRTLGWALRLGVVMTVVGSASGGLMTRLMPGQDVRHIVGSHTVGAPDGGPGVPITRWSSDHGDLRIGHFVGLHGMQMIPLFYWLLLRKRKASIASVAVVAAGYFSAFLLLEWQALRGQSILQPDTLTLAYWFVWLVVFGSTLLAASTSWRKFGLHTAAGAI